jgi:glycosyltransferase involved in cell wall biosynthesis
LKILFLTDNFPPEVNAPATRTLEHCKEWVKMGAEVTVVTGFPNFPGGKIYPGYKNRWRKTEIIDGIQVVRVWTYMTANKGTIRRTLDYISFMISAVLVSLTIRTDLIIATSPQFFTAVGGYILAKLKRKPWVMEVRDLWPDSIIGVEAMERNRVLDLFFRLELRLYRHASMIVPVTNTFRQRIIGKGIDPEKIHVIRNGANLELFRPIPPDIRLKQEISGQRPLIMSYIGTHGLAHGLEFIVGCAPELAQLGITLLLIGDGAKKQDILDKISRNRYTNVISLPPVPKEEIPRYLAISDIALIPLRRAEIFETVIPSKIFEAAAMQIPILLGVAGEARELVESYLAGISYLPENKEDLLAKCKKLTEDRLACNVFQAGGKKLSLDFDRKKQAQAFFLLIEKFLKNRMNED